ncbi:hypothetical protein RHMOL_Rhmol07G0158900 [Rhododendron molle]|uniref:Uncharacterized protein n=1 Tax=Rhododendron molle TaxID=49168 RepID=A0ACC0N108_RHOML|nr:hypothetical protein RHMOL_Rhmol07G0158900 [Rhododendron molle]
MPEAQASWALGLGRPWSLTIVLEEGKTNVKLETDALVAVKMTSEENNENHPQSNIISDARILINRRGTTLPHIFREGSITYSTKWQSGCLY